MSRFPRAALGLVLAALGVLAVTAHLRAQVNDPMAVVSGFYRALEKGDDAAARAFLLAPAETSEEYREAASVAIGHAPLWQPPLRGCVSNVKNLATALEMYSTDNSGRYPTLLSQLTPDYLRTIPTCPSAGLDTYSAGYTVVARPDGYTVECSGHHHGDEGLPADFPRYTSTEGISYGVKPPEPELAWKLESYRILGEKGEGPVTVSVEETYAYQGYPCRILSDYRVVKTPTGWRIDGADLARRTGFWTKTPSRFGPFGWFRTWGIGVSFAAACTQAPPPPPLDALQTCEENLKNIGTAMEMYSTDNLGRFPTVLSLLAPNYLKRLPTCPAAHADTYSAGFQSASNPDAYTISCSGHHHGSRGIGPNSPSYTSTQGLLIEQQKGR
jgi:hypothetical protein